MHGQRQIGGGIDRQIANIPIHHAATIGRSPAARAHKNCPGRQWVADNRIAGGGVTTIGERNRVTKVCPRIDIRRAGFEHEHIRSRQNKIHVGSRVVRQVRIGYARRSGDTDGIGEKPTDIVQDSRLQSQSGTAPRRQVETTPNPVDGIEGSLIGNESEI